MSGLFAYLEDLAVEIAQSERVRRAALDAVAAVRRFEATTRVTYGATYSDGLHIRVDAGTGRLGLIDCGAVRGRRCCQTVRGAREGRPRHRHHLPGAGRLHQRLSRVATPSTVAAGA